MHYADREIDNEVFLMSAGSYLQTEGWRTIPIPERRYFHTICQRHRSVDDDGDAPHAPLGVRGAPVVAQDKLYQPQRADHERSGSGLSVRPLLLGYPESARVGIEDRDAAVGADLLDS